MPRIGGSSRQLFEAAAPDYGPGTVTVKINKRDGDYNGKAAARPYQLNVHAGAAPNDVQIGGTRLGRLADKAAFDAAATGWYFDAANNGTVHVKTAPIAADAVATVLLKQVGPLGGAGQDNSAAEVRVTTGKQVFQEHETTVTAVFVNTGKRAKNNVQLAPALPEGWTVKSASGATAATVAGGASVTATFVVIPGAAAKAGLQTVRISASYTSVDGTAQTVAGANQIYVAYGSLAAAYNTVSVTTVANKALGNFDGGGPPSLRNSWPPPRFRPAASPRAALSRSTPEPPNRWTSPGLRRDRMCPTRWRSRRRPSP